MLKCQFKDATSCMCIVQEILGAEITSMHRVFDYLLAMIIPLGRIALIKAVRWIACEYKGEKDFSGLKDAKDLVENYTIVSEEEDEDANRWQRTVDQWKTHYDAVCHENRMFQQRVNELNDKLDAKDKRISDFIHQDNEEMINLHKVNDDLLRQVAGLELYIGIKRNT